jgi:HD-GYP domain-containing protein (c-di-GMP phosphodiesterase class II)
MMDSKSVFLIDNTTTTQIDVKDLKLGMFVSELDRPWEETNFLFQGFTLQNQADIEAVQAQCRYVFIDVTKQISIAQPKVREIEYSSDRKSDVNPAQNQAHYKDQMSHASQARGQLSTVVKNFMQQVSLGHGINIALAKEAVAACVDNIVRSPDAMMWLTQLKNRDEYTSQHSMNVAIFAIALGKHLNYSIPELNNLGLCGIMHDMGKMRIPLEVLNKPGQLTLEEARIMKSHTTLGWKLLMSSSGMYGGAIDVAYSHHERLDGRGYPRGLKDEQISPYTRIVAIADTYDAITSDRVYKRGRTHLEAITVMTKDAGAHLDAKLTAKFVECLGVFPPGSLIEMTNGEVAVVIASDPKYKLKPTVVRLLDEDKQPCPSVLIKLSQMSLDRAGQPYRIKRMIKAEDYMIDLTAFYRKHLLEHS